MISAQKNLISKLRRIPSNSQCCECKSSQASYADLTVGSFVCPRCSNYLRGIGHSIQGFAMGEFDIESAYFLERNGNERVNAAYLATAPHFDIDFDNDSAVKKFLEAKYLQKKWYREISEKIPEKPKKLAPIQSLSTTPKAMEVFSKPLPEKIEVTPTPIPTPQKEETPIPFLGAPKIIEAPFDLDSLISATNSTKIADPFAEALTEEPQIHNPFTDFDEPCQKSDINIDNLFAPTLRRRDLNK